MAIDPYESYLLTGEQIQDLARRLAGKQDGLTAGSNITISSNTISATDTTYSNFTGATSSVAGSNGLVPAPAAGDDTKFLAGDGTWQTVQAGGAVTTFYWNGSAMYKDSGYSTAATISDVETAANAGPVRIRFAGLGRYEYLVTDTITAGEYFSTVWATSNGRLRSVVYTYTSNTWSRTSVNVQNELTAGTNINIASDGTISATDTTYSDFTGATASVAGAHGLVPAPAAGDESKALLGNGTWGDATAKLVEMSYGESSAWAKFIAAYNAGSIVYCRASSNANPGTGSQTRKAFMAYVNNATSPTSVEFQYVRSVSSKSASQPVDQVFVYTLTNSNGGTWSVATRDMAPKLAAGTNTSVSYSSGTYTVSATDTTYSDMTGATSGTAGAAGLAPAPAAGDENKFLAGDGTWKTAGGGKEVTIVVSDLRPSQYFPDAFLELQMTDYPAAQQYESNLNGNFYGTSGYFAFLNEDLDHYLTIDELGGYFRDGYKINVINGLNMYGGSTALQDMTISGMVLNASDRYNEFVLMTINSDQIGNQYMGLFSTRKGMSGGTNHNIYTGRIS